MAYWKNEKFEDKIRKRMQKDTDCEIIYPSNKEEKVISIDDYKEFAKNVVKNPYIEVKYYHRKSGCNRRAFANEEVLVSITEAEGNRLETCFHLHFSVDRCEEIMGMTKEDRKRIFEDWIDRKNKIGEKTNIEWVKKGDE
ncbi:hypothetical protein GGQ13_002981 [Salinibacter ruber]|uniref:hypothetical protein n=1 Tax=Salinibacter ruber TaxID=146919 RepID=UPI002169FDFF|nr:hypothetical protein [Salinibacter ruber]MCS4139526.1 hypothetical protein [Salinibacter ruber]